MEISKLVNESQALNPEAHKAVRLVEYLLRLATLRAKLIRDINEYEKVLWVSSVPRERGCFTQAWGRDEEHEPDEWNELPELLSEITRQIPNSDWHEGSDQPRTISHIEHIGDHPEVQQAWDRYVGGKWLPWTGDHNAWEKVHNVYSTLFWSTRGSFSAYGLDQRE
jgi:hypothetical protein